MIVSKTGQAEGTTTVEENMRGGKGGKAWATRKVVVNRVCHGYHRYGYGSEFWHTVAHHVPIQQYHRYAQVNYNKVRINLIVLKLVFLNSFFSKLKVSHHDRTQYGSVSHPYIFASYHHPLTPTSIQPQKQCKP